jgi:hypothetical protein
MPAAEVVEDIQVVVEIQELAETVEAETVVVIQVQEEEQELQVNQIEVEAVVDRIQALTVLEDQESL